MKLRTREQRSGSKYSTTSVDPLDPFPHLNGRAARLPDRFILTSTGAQLRDAAPDLATQRHIVAGRARGDAPCHRQKFNVPRNTNPTPKGN
jgi:hypothetical protein